MTSLITQNPLYADPYESTGQFTRDDLESALSRIEQEQSLSRSQARRYLIEQIDLARRKKVIGSASVRLDADLQPDGPNGRRLGNRVMVERENKERVFLNKTGTPVSQKRPRFKIPTVNEIIESEGRVVEPVTEEDTLVLEKVLRDTAPSASNQRENVNRAKVKSAATSSKSRGSSTQFMIEADTPADRKNVKKTHVRSKTKKKEPTPGTATSIIVNEIRDRGKKAAYTSLRAMARFDSMTDKQLLQRIREVAWRYDLDVKTLI